MFQPQKYPTLSQLIICTGKHCAGKEGERSPKEALREVWREEYLWRVCRLSFSECLGPCNLRGNAIFMTPEGTTWLGGLTPERYPLFADWARDCKKEGKLLPLPAELTGETYHRFSEPGTFPLERPE